MRLWQRLSLPDELQSAACQSKLITLVVHAGANTASLSSSTTHTHALVIMSVVHTGGQGRVQEAKPAAAEANAIKKSKWWKVW